MAEKRQNQLSDVGVSVWSNVTRRRMFQHKTYVVVVVFFSVPEKKEPPKNITH